MKTITIQIGNSGDKLTQEEWPDFHSATDIVVHRQAKRVHFSGTPPSKARKRNACWVFEAPRAEDLRAEVTRSRRIYHQNSVAWTEGTTEFL